MNEPLWTDIAQAVGAVGAVVVAVPAFLVLILQIRQLSQAIQAESHGRIYEHALEVQKLFVERPEFRPFFYDNARPDPRAQNYGSLLAFAELVADYLEHITLQRCHVPPDVQKAWENYTQVLITSSPVLQDFLRQHDRTYCERFRKIAEELLCAPVTPLKL